MPRAKTQIVPVHFEFVEEVDGKKIWKVEALHVTITKNNRKYTEQELVLGARSLSFRPLNIDHDESLTLPCPANSTLEMDFDFPKRAVTGRIAISEARINQMIENGDINRLSVEQLPVKGETCNQMICEQHGVTFIGLALLRKETMPGDGDTKIMAESVKECTFCQIMEIVPSTKNKDAKSVQESAEVREIVYSIRIENLDETITKLRELKALTSKEDITIPQGQSNTDSKKKKKELDVVDVVQDGEQIDGGNVADPVDSCTIKMLLAHPGMNPQAARDFCSTANVGFEADSETGKCIAHYVNSGKDQDQAVAICSNDPGSAKESKLPDNWKIIAREAYNIVEAERLYMTDAILKNLK